MRLSSSFYDEAAGRRPSRHLADLPLNDRGQLVRRRRDRGCWVARGEEQRSCFFRNPELTQRAVTKPNSARFDVGDGTTRVLVTIVDKGPAKTAVAVEQSRLADGDAREEAKAFWRAALVTLKASLESGGPASSGGRR